MFRYRDYGIDASKYNTTKNFRLENTYELCVSELGLQQKKRDQTIAFYIAIISFVIPAIINMKVNPQAKGAGFMALFILGIMLAKVVVRYRIYKEVYWITCRTITQLYNLKEDEITKEIVHHIFYKTMEKNVGSVLVFRPGPEKKVKPFSSYRKILNSAETILYQVLLLMSSMVLWIAVYMFTNFHIYGAIGATVIVLANYIFWSAHYYKELTKVYDVIIDGTDKSFNGAYSKAWFLHIF
ncbi:hypothetical protein [Paenibacillus sp. sgz500958]|uniref:hypothetical protein n=1 Tax=Paenibacillus sp. sgz500958 TaxID=3242475 RepID=UPI0036D2EFDB